MLTYAATAKPTAPDGAGRRAQSSSDGKALLLSESATLLGGPPSLFQSLTPRERDLVLSHGRRRVIYRGQTLFSQGAPHEGIYLIETGRIRVFYIAPSGREITLAYWYPGNFVGGPEIFGGGTHHVVGRCDHQQQRGADSRQGTAHAGRCRFRACRRLIEGLTFKGKCYSALAQMLGTRSITERLAHLLLHLVDLYGVEEPRWHPDRRSLHPCGSRPHGRRHPAMDHDQPQAPAGTGRGVCRKSRIVVRRARCAGGDAGTGLGLSRDAHVIGTCQQNCPTSMQPVI